MSQEYHQYFNYRQLEHGSYEDYQLPFCLASLLPADKDLPILDIGCGFGQTMMALKRLGYNRVEGVDVSAQAVNSCLDQGLQVELIDNLEAYTAATDKRYALIIMSHVIEHLDKTKVVATLAGIRRLLSTEALGLFIATPNAQSPVGTYWAFEDFTHQTLFTAGSLTYVLKAAGYEQLNFLDEDSTAGRPLLKRLVRRWLSKWYLARMRFWYAVLDCQYHRPSKQIFTWELKILTK